MHEKDHYIAKTIPSRTDRLLEVREFVAEEARSFGFGDEDVANIVLAVDEACTNVIKHAYQFASDRSVEVVVRRAQGQFEVRIIDDGRPFDPESVKPPDLKHQKSHLRRGGLGVYLMKRLMDKVEYSFAPGKKNEVRLVKYLAGHTAVAKR